MNTYIIYKSVILQYLLISLYHSAVSTSSAPSTGSFLYILKATNAIAAVMHAISSSTNAVFL